MDVIKKTGNNIPTVFISYSGRDKNAIARIAKDLSTEGFVVWFDDWSILPGQSIVAEIQNGVDNSDYLLFCMSPASISSVWVKEEVHSAIARSINKNSPYLIPLLLEDCEIPTLIAHRRYIDFRSNYEHAYQSLKKILSGGKVCPPPSTTHRFIKDWNENTVYADGHTIMKRRREIVAVGSPLHSLQLPFHTTATPDMTADNIDFICLQSARYTSRVITRGSDFILVQINFDPPLAPGEAPVEVQYSYDIKKCYPSKYEEMLWQRDHGCVDWNILYDGVLLPVPVEQMIYAINIERTTYSTPSLWVVQGMEGKPYRLELERVERTGNVKYAVNADWASFNFAIENVMPGIFYGAQWNLRNQPAES